MAAITASMVKDLREKTGAGMMDAKKALEENGGNLEKAVDWLRTKGLAKAEKKSGRTAAEGLVAIAAQGNKGAVIEINAETDFVARNEKFQAFVKKAADIALKGAGTAEALAKQEYEGGKSVADTLTGLIATIGENMTLRRAQKLEVSKGLVAGYIHGALADGLGKIGVLVALESAAPAEKLEGVGKQIAMHIAAANPQFLNIASVDPAVAEREKNVIREQAKGSGKPADIIEKMLDGRMRKFYEEICLVEQIFVIDGETKISKVIANAAAEAGSPIELKGYVRFQLGEGIAKEEDNFAEEVAAMAGRR